MTKLLALLSAIKVRYLVSVHFLLQDPARLIVSKLFGLDENRVVGFIRFCSSISVLAAVIELDTWDENVVFKNLRWV